MILNRVILENFISHKSTEIKLERGINVIVGPNGAGKTSILEGISFALFNVHSRGKKENLINSMADKCKLRVDFTENGLEYSVEWLIERKKASHGSLFRVKESDKMLLARGGERVIAGEVEKILGIDKDMFLQSIYIRQGEVEKLVTVLPGKRKELISKLLGIEDLEKVWKNMKEITSEYEQKKANLDGELKKLSESEKEKEIVEIELSELGYSLELKKEGLKGVKEKIYSLQAVLKKLSDTKNTFERLDSDRKIIEKEIEYVKRELEEKRRELDKAKEASKRVKEIEGEVNRLPFLERYEKFMLRKKNKELEKERLQEKLSHVELLIKTLQDNVEGYNQYEEKSNILRERREVKKKYEGAKEALRRELRQFEENRRDGEKKEEEIGRELKEYSTILEEEVDIESLEAVLHRKIGDIENLKTAIEANISKFDQGIGAAKGRIKEIEYNFSKIAEADVCPICGRELTPDHIKRIYEEFTREKKRIEGEIAKLRREEEEKIKERGEIGKKLQKLGSVDPARIKKLNTQLTEIKNKRIQQKLEIEELEKKVERLKELDKEINKLEYEIEVVKEAYQSYESAKREVARLPSKEELDAKLKPVMKTLEGIFSALKEVVEKIGYEPREQERELEELRKKKKEYDRNEPIARRKPQLELEIGKIEEEIEDKRIALSIVINEIEKLEYNEELHKRKEGELEIEELHKSGIDKEIVEIETRVRDLNEVLSRLKKEMEELFEKEKEKKRVEKFIKILYKIREAFGKDGLQKLIRARAKPMIESTTREFFEKFNLGYSDIEIDDNYEIRVTDSNGWSEDIEQISGGERVSLAIALRLGIARVLSGKIETIIMDEPTTHLDEERRKELFNILNSFFREGGRIVPQMIIITHHREIEDVGDVIYEVSKKEGYSMTEAVKAEVGTGASTAF